MIVSCETTSSTMMVGVIDSSNIAATGSHIHIHKCKLDDDMCDKKNQRRERGQERNPKI